MDHQTGKKLLSLQASRPIFAALIVLFSFPAWSQWMQGTTNCPRSGRQAMVWYFGDKAGIDFRSGDAVSLPDQSVMNAAKGTAVICDSLGNFLFMTDGIKVWDRNFDEMTNATALNGSKGATQPCIILPRPGDPDFYYLFTIDRVKPVKPGVDTTKGLCLTLIDMKRRNGMGDAPPEVINKPILTPVASKITAVRHKNGNDYWVIVHRYNSDLFYAYKLNGLELEPPVISAVGSRHEGINGSEYNNSLGYMKASPDGKRLAVAIPDKKLIELFSFNDETGVVSAPQSYLTAIPGINPYGLEFSPDSRKLYATIFEMGGSTSSRPSYIVQFDLKQGLTNPLVIDSVAGIRLTSMQLGTDGRIYISRTFNLQTFKDSLDVIYNPNRAGKACNHNFLNGDPDKKLYLDNRKSLYSMPNFVQSYFNIPTFTWENVCQNDVTSFRITNNANIDSVHWDFGDGGFSTMNDPMHRYSGPGNYQVVLKEYFNGSIFSDSLWVVNYRLPQISLADTILLYTGSSINLHAGGGFMEYLWNTKSTDSVITVSKQGTYIARVKDFHCCENSDTTYVKVFEYFIPNAFSPNGDGLNDIFQVSGLYRDIEFRMIIYDRWGRQVFESRDIEKGWDGRFGGELCEPDSYVWVVTIAFTGDDIITTGDIRFKGTITLVR